MSLLMRIFAKTVLKFENQANQKYYENSFNFSGA